MQEMQTDSQRAVVWQRLEKNTGMQVRIYYVSYNATGKLQEINLKD